jgi:hypothetical protein
VFVHAGDEVRFIGLPPPSTADIARINKQIARATEKQNAELDPDEELPDVLALDQVDTTREPRPVAPGTDSSQRAYGRSAFLFGYSLHADRHINFDDREGLERLARYGARAPIANVCRSTTAVAPSSSSSAATSTAAPTSHSSPSSYSDASPPSFRRPGRT